MQNKRIIHENDYGSYLLDYSRKQLNPFLSYKNRGKYVLSELERRHPCFEGQCKTDGQLVSENGKGKIWAVVMDVGRLTKYRGAPGGKKLYAPFLAKSKKIHYKRVFKQGYFFKNRMRIFSVALGTVFFGIAVLLWGVSFFKSEQKTAAGALALQNEQKTVAATLAMLGVSSKTFMDSLDASLKNGAICTQFEYESDRISQNSGDFRASIRASLTGIYPEQVYTLFYGQNGAKLLSNSENAIEISSTAFKDSVPSLDVSFVGKGYASVGGVFIAKNDSVVRSLVVDYKGSVQTEDFSSQSITFNIAPSNWRSFFETLSNHLRQNNLTFKNLALNCAKNDEAVSVQFSLTTGEMPIELRKLNTVFDTQSEWYENATKPIPKIPVIVTAKLRPNIQEMKLGMVKKMNGIVISFYATTDGKIISMEE